MSQAEVPDDLRRLAAVAAREFLREDASLALIAHGLSLTHRVEASSGAYLLRVHSPRFVFEDPAFDAAEVIEGECAWLRALSDETELVVQEPVPSPTGGYVLTLPRSDDGGEVPCTLLRWIEGEHFQGRRADPQARQLGTLLAQLHTHSRGWNPPPGFTRPTHGTSMFRRALARTEQLVTTGIASESQRALLAAAIDRVDRELTPLERYPERVGLIHADLHGGNYVYHEGSPRPIDFGRAGFGPWLYDLAESLAHLGPGPRRALVDAYAEHQPFDDEDLRRAEGYFVASLVETFGNNAADPDEREFLTAAVPAWAPHFERYVAGTPFLFEL